MTKISLEEAYHVLKRFKHVLHEEDAAKLSASMHEDGLVLKIKSYSESVMLFPFDKNESVIVNENSISMKDCNNWTQIFQPLVIAKLKVD